MSNERTQAEIFFSTIDRRVHNFFYDRPHLNSGWKGLLLSPWKRAGHTWKQEIWNRYAYTKSGRMTWATSLPPLIITLLIIFSPLIFALLF